MPKICLDPGHSGATYNTGGWGYYESKRMWDFHLLLSQELKNRGFEVITTRSSIDANPELYSRGATSKGCDCFISLHSNGVEKSPSTDYTVVFYPLDGRNNSASIALKLAQGIASLMGNKQTAQAKIYPQANGSKTEYLGVMRGAQGVGCPLYMLFEHSFHTNEAAAKWLLSDDNLKNLAVLEADILAHHFGVSGSDAVTPTVAQTTTAPATTGENFLVKVTTDSLNIRGGAGTTFDVVGSIEDRGVYTITEEKDGWGKLKSGQGWISLAYTEKK